MTNQLQVCNWLVHHPEILKLANEMLSSTTTSLTSPPLTTASLTSPLTTASLTRSSSPLTDNVKLLLKLISNI
jgi:hypothetical protein